MFHIEEVQEVDPEGVLEAEEEDSKIEIGESIIKALDLIRGEETGRKKSQTQIDLIAC